MTPVSSGKRFYDPRETERMTALQGVELAPFGSRALALLIDFLLAAVMFVVVVGGTMKLMERVLHHPIQENIELNFFHNWYSVVYLVLFFGVSNYLGNGRTLGKRLMGIRAVSLVHPQLGLWHSLERALGYGASTLEAGFGFLQFFIHPNRRAVHDRIAETIVIREP